MANWIYEIENKIFTTIAYRVKQVFSSEFPNMFFTMDAEPEDTTSHFPTVFIHYLPSTEYGSTLKNTEIPCIESTIQIEVTTNKEQGQKNARLIAWETVEQFKKLSYSVILSPEVIKTGNDTNYVVARVRRKIADGDVIG